MTTTLVGGLVASVMVVLMGTAPVEAGAGRATAASADSASIVRVAHSGHARSFDWHRSKTRAARANMKDSDRRQVVRVAGRGGWVCSPAGAGSGSTCTAR